MLRPLACVVAVAIVSTAHAAPTITVRARTRIVIDTVVRSSEDSVAVVGRLLDDAGAGVPDMTVRLSFGGQAQTVETDERGAFELEFPVGRGEHQLEARYAGEGPYAGAAYEPQKFDVGKDTMRLAVRTPSDVGIDEEGLNVSVEAQSTFAPQSVTVTLHIMEGDKPRRVGDLVTDESGAGTTRIPRDRLGRAGDKRLLAIFAGNEAFNRAEAQARFRLMSATKFEDIGLPPGPVKYEGKVRVTGKVVEVGGPPVEGVTVALMSGDHALTAGLTDRAGRFTVAVNAAEFTPGEVQLRLAYVSNTSWRRGVESAPLTVIVARPKPIPIRYTVFAFIATALALATFVFVRARPWVAWRERWRKRRRAATGPEAVAARADEPVQAGLKPARHSLMSTLRRAADLGFSGRVRDAIRGDALAGAEITLSSETETSITLVADHDGAFAVERLAPGTWAGKARAAGYVTEAFTVGIPHRGELRGVRIDLLPVRERVFQIYRDIAAPLLPRPELWGLWTPREIFDHVRKKRPAGALGELTDFVEATYFGARVPDESVLPFAHEGAAAARRELRGA